MSKEQATGSSQQIVLVGLSGVGKSSVGRVLAERLGWPLFDTDHLIAEHEGATAAELITAQGEAAFRRIEERVVTEIARRAPAVIATGGGAFLSPTARRALGERGLIYYLDATPTEIAQRIRSAPDAEERPLLGEDLEGRLDELDAERRPYYAHADHWVPTQSATPEQSAARILRHWAEGPPAGGEHRLQRLGAAGPAQAPAALVDTGRERYPIWVGRGELDRLPERLQQLDLAGGRVFVISDTQVMAAHGEQIAGVLDGAGIAGSSYLVPPGEPSKALRVVSELYRWLADQHAERGDTVVALGGGVIGDLAGFTAATYLRGMPLVQVPTTVLAMNDASIGGKTGVDLPGGKNLVGTFKQPRAVVADIDTLTTLPRRAFLEGFAEVIKHALILDPVLLGELERHAGRLGPSDPDLDLLAQVAARSARLKALIVSSDAEEQGLRAILNYGHTIGHGIEAASGYTDYLHGEAVAVGMMGAGRIAQHLGMLDAEVVARQADLLRAFGLPLAAPGVSAQAILDAMRLDKKVAHGRQHFVLLERPGRPVVRDDVPDALVEETVRGLVAGG